MYKLKRISISLGQRVSISSTLFHALHWALVEVGATQRDNEWSLPVKAACQLMGAPEQREIDLLQQDGLERLLNTAKSIQSDMFQIKFRATRHDKRPTSPRARAPKNHKIKIPGQDPVILAVAASLCTQSLGLRGMNHGRSYYSALGEPARELLGDIPLAIAERKDNDFIALLASICATIRKYRLPPPIQAPKFLKKDPYFAKICESKTTRAMNPEVRFSQLCD